MRATRENLPCGQFFRNLAIKKPMVSLSALQGRGAAIPACSQLSSGLNLWRRCSCSGESPAPSIPSAPTWGSWGKHRRVIRWCSPDVTLHICKRVHMDEVALPAAEAWGRGKHWGPRRLAPRSLRESLCRCCRPGPHLSSITALPAITQDVQM